MAGEFKKIPLDRLQPKLITRRDLGDLDSLAESISRRGILEPLLVSEAGDGSYEVIDGLRRYLAAQIAGLEDVPVSIIGKDVDLYEALEIIWEEDKFKKKLRVDEKSLIVTVFVDRYGVREASRRLKMPKSTVETLAKAGRVFSAVWKSVRASDSQINQLKFKVNVKLAEAVARKLSNLDYSRDRFREVAAKLYLSLSSLPTKIALQSLDKWFEKPDLDKINELINEFKNATGASRFKPLKIHERVPIDVSLKTSYEELLIKCGYDSKSSYDVSGEASFKIVDFKDGYGAVSGFLCLRCGQPVRCRVCGAVVNCLCGYPHSSVKGRRYRYVRLMEREES